LQKSRMPQILGVEGEAAPPCGAGIGDAG